MSKIADFNQGLVLETPARLDWHPLIESVIFDDTQVTAYPAFEPSFPHCAAPLFELDIVLDIRALIDSAVRPGGYFLLTCTCGYGEHAGLNDQVHVAHPNPNQIVWELDIELLAPALDSRLKAPGFLRLVFDRPDYLASVRRLLAHAREIAETPQPLSLCHDQEEPGVVLARAAGHSMLVVDGIDPGFDNDDSLSHLVSSTADIDWTARSMVAANSLIEIGLFGPEPCRVTGDNEPGYITHWFTRHAVARAWDAWPATRHWINRSKARKQNLPIPDPDADRSHFTIALGADPAKFHRLGQRFAELLQASLAEGQTSPGPRVIYLSN
jgi:hypothetical protein